MNAAELGVYFALVLGIVLLPGVDMAFVVGWSLAGGWRTGAAALAGVVAGALCHLAMGALGLALLLRTVPGAFAAMMMAGALYLAWLGWGLMRAQPAEPAEPAEAVDAAQPADAGHPVGAAGDGAGTGTAVPGFPAARRGGGLGAAFGGAMLTNLLNPKAYLFSLAVLPQFLHPERGGLAWQLGAIGVVTALTQISVYGGLAVMATAGHQKLRGMSAARQRLLLRAVGLMLWAMALYTVYSGWRTEGAGVGVDGVPPTPASFTRAA